ncbi:hypothetical protein KY306_03435, partial [Candidatus Woesearchaeota archaeon]|nr:hypothetical protein [Candidatus Woesearchaeota archaeon]
MAKNNKDPWHKNNIDDTLKKRKNDQRNLLNVVQAMDSQLIYEVTKILKDHSGKDIPDWSLLDSEHKSYNKEVADKVRAKIDEVYSLDSKLHPLKDVIKKANLERNYFNEQLVKGIYFKHTHQLKRGIGSENYMATMQERHKDNLDEVVKATSEHLLSDLDPDKHADYVLDFLKDKYKFDKEKVSTDSMKNKVHELMVRHVAQRLSKDYIHR